MTLGTWPRPRRSGLSAARLLFFFVPLHSVFFGRESPHSPHLQGEGPCSPRRGVPEAPTPEAAAPLREATRLSVPQVGVVFYHCHFKEPYLSEVGLLLMLHLLFKRQWLICCCFQEPRELSAYVISLPVKRICERRKRISFQPEGAEILSANKDTESIRSPEAKPLKRSLL